MARIWVVGCAVLIVVVCGRPASLSQLPPAPADQPGTGVETGGQASSQCAVADDAGYGYTPEQAVQVGGGAMFVASRERRYLDALRGPAGEPVRYKRTGTTTLEPNAVSIIDVYEVVYDGAERPLTLYLDAYHFDDALRAPRGLICGTPIALTAPGPDLFQSSRFLVMLAVEQGGSRDFAPIPLDTVSDGTRTRRGIVLDHFRMMARMTRVAAAAGKPIVLDPAIRPPDSLRQRTVVVAYPQTCEARSIAPRSIELLTQQGQQAPRQGQYDTAEELGMLVPGLDAPPGSVAATFGLQVPRPGDVVKITYADSCGGPAYVTVPLEQTPLRPLHTPEPTLPEGVTVTRDTVRLQAQVDLDGALRYITYVGGPRELLQAATHAVRGWTVEPVRINDAPISTPIVLQVKFLPR
jgi:hypothetical protein